MASDPCSSLLGCCCALSCLTFLILMILSFSQLDINEYGLDYSAIKKSVAKEPLTAGIHFLGIGHSFIKYPRTVQTIEFSNDNQRSNGPAIRSRTQDGLEVILEISFQWKVIFADLYQNYMTFANEYQRIYERTSQDILTEAATNYTAYDFFMDRQKIGSNMQTQLNNAFKQKLFATVDFFQLRSVDLPDKFENAIQQSEVKKQEIQKAHAEKNKTQVTLETLKLTAQYQRNVTLNLALGDSQAILAQATANAKAFQLVQQTNSKAYQRLKQKLKLQNSDLIQFMKAKLVRDYNDNSLTVSMTKLDNGTAG